MADTIAIMNQGVIEQLGAPQEIYDRPATHVRGRLHRLAADELPAASTAASQPGAQARRDRRRARSRVPDAARGRAGAASWCCGVRPGARALRRRVARCAARCSAPSISAPRQIVTVDTRRARRQGAALPCEHAGRSVGEPVGLAFDAAAAVAVRQASGRALPHRRCTTRGGAPWLRSALEGVTKRFGDDAGGRRRCRSTIADGEFVVLLGPTGAGKTTTLRLVAGLETARRRAASHIGGARRDRRCRRPRATSPSCSSSIRSIRI